MATTAKNTLEDRNTKYKANALPVKIERKLYVWYGIGAYVAGEVGIHDYDVTKHVSDGFERVLLCTTSVKVNIPKKQDLKGKALIVLEAEKTKVLAENHARLRKVQDKIDNLLAIEYKPAAEGK